MRLVVARLTGAMSTTSFHPGRTIPEEVKPATKATFLCGNRGEGVGDSKVMAARITAGKRKYDRRV